MKDISILLQVYILHVLANSLCSLLSCLLKNGINI